MAMYQQTLDQLAELKLNGFKEAFIIQAQSPSYMHMSFEERLAHLVDSEVIYRNNNRIKRFLMTKMKILILDDFGVSPMDTREAQELLEVIEDRVGLGSIIMTSQLPVDHWYDYLNNGTIADAVLDRLVHNSYRLNLQGESLRKMTSSLNKKKD